MSKLSLNIDGDFKFDTNKYPFLKISAVKKKAASFVKGQYPSKTNIHDGEIDFANSVFRFKVNRSRNVLRAFHKGSIKVSKVENSIIIKYSGKLTRGLTISALHTLVVFVIFAYSAPQALYVAPLFFILNYFLQIYLTHIVFPMNLGKAFHELLVDENNENT
ncbi:MAG: hypothetical protein JXQ87_16350 [Bacteroidia bacterium]